MSNDPPPPSPYTNDRPDLASEPKSTVADVSGAVKSAAHTETPLGPSAEGVVRNHHAMRLRVHPAAGKYRIANSI